MEKMYLIKRADKLKYGDVVGSNGTFEHWVITEPIPNPENSNEVIVETYGWPVRARYIYRKDQLIQVKYNIIQERARRK